MTERDHRDDDPWGRPAPKGQPTHRVGQDLSALSQAEIEARIVLLGEEIRRLEAALAAKRASAHAADSFFRKGS